eukprot:1158508-Pelagomonas_calceolata.AAC.45
MQRFKTKTTQKHPTKGRPNNTMPEAPTAPSSRKYSFSAVLGLPGIPCSTCSTSRHSCSVPWSGSAPEPPKHRRFLSSVPCFAATLAVSLGTAAQCPGQALHRCCQGKAQDDSVVKVYRNFKKANTQSRCARTYCKCCNKTWLTKKPAVKTHDCQAIVSRALDGISEIHVRPGTVALCPDHALQMKMNYTCHLCRIHLWKGPAQKCYQSKAHYGLYHKSKALISVSKTNKQLHPRVICNLLSAPAT